MTPTQGPGRPGRGLRELASIFLRLGVTSFGGPAAHIALMRDEFVRRRGWLDDATYLDLIGAANLIPGPTSTEVAMHVGHRRAGWPGLVVAGLAFILPAVLIVAVLAWIYVTQGSRPEVEALLLAGRPGRRRDHRLRGRQHRADGGADAPWRRFRGRRRSSSCCSGSRKWPCCWDWVS